MLKKIKDIILYLVGLPKTLYFNFKYFDFALAIKLPVLISHRVVLVNINGKININSNNITTGMVRLGFGGIGIFDQKRSRSIWQVSGNVIFNGTCNIGHGSKIVVNENGTVVFGNNFNISAETSILCHKRISFGNDCVISWDNLIMDTDFHKIMDESGRIINKDKEIAIGNKVWIGCRCAILKGTSISDNCVIAANSTIAREYLEQNQIIGGNPAHMLKSNITWEA
ncbi:MAG TPA: hypothetical protein VIK26_04190 [Clostridium sp.]